MAASNARSVINKVKWSAADFDTHFDDLRARLQVKYADEFNDFALSSLGILLIDLQSFGLDGLSFFMDRRATEAYLDTARTRSAVARICRQLGYKMGPATASSVDLDVAITIPQAIAVPVPKGFQFKGPNDLIFEAAEAVTFAPGDGPADVRTIPVYEGETVIETFTSNGTPNQIYKLRKVPTDKALALGTVKVIVDGGEWTETKFISIDLTNQFEVNYNDDPPSIEFGDGVAGNIPPNTASISVQYVASRGKTGQVSGGTIQAVVSPLVVAFTTIPLTINNPERSVGGDDPETIEHAKAFAGRFFKTRGVAVTREDYEALAGSYADPLFGRVAVAQAVSARSAADDLELATRVQSIGDSADAVVAPVNAAVASAQAQLTAANVSLSDLLTTLSSIAAKTTTIGSTTDSAITNTRTAKNSATEVLSDAANLSQFISDISVDATALDPSIVLDVTAFIATLQERLIEMTTIISTSLQVAAATIQSSAASALQSLGVMQDDLNSVGLSISTSGTLLKEAADAQADVVVQIGTAAPASGAMGDIASIGALVLTLSGSIEDDLAAITDHVDRLLSSECAANLVSVPILTRDASGFYAAPSISLIHSLQNFLDARKEVTQTVQVTSGERALVPAVVVLKVYSLPNYSTTLVGKAVNIVLDAILKDRPFGLDLCVSDISDPILAIKGVDFVDVDIQGNYFPPSSITLVTENLDLGGNLIIEESEVVTKGATTVTVVQSARTNTSQN